MLSLKNICCIVAAALLLPACAPSTRTIPALTSSNSGYLSSDTEKKLIAESDRVHQELVQRGLVVTDPETLAYLNRIGDRLRPALSDGPTLHYYLLKDAAINAMAFPNGNIYVNVGLVTKLDSEDQLALVLAHETAHVVQRHSYKGQLDRKNTVVAAHVADLLLAGTGIAYLPAITSLASFSRDQEQDADLRGIEYMTGKGYDLPHSVEVFDKLREVKYEGSDGSIWASHPDLVARKTYSLQTIAKLEKNAAASDAVAPTIGAYEQFRRKSAVLAIQLRMANGQYELAGDAIDYEIARQGDGAVWHVLKGDVARETAQHPDIAAREYAWLYKKSDNEQLRKSFEQKAPQRLTEALTEYERALQLDAGAIDALRGIGLVAYAQNDGVRAKKYLQSYLDSAGKPSDRRYIENMIKRQLQ